MDYDKLADYFSHKGYKTVALITTTFPPYPNEARSSSVGGATMDLIYTVDFLTKRGFKVSVLALDFRGSVKKPDPPGVLRVGSYVPYSFGGLSSGFTYVASELVDPLLFYRLHKFLKKIRPDILILGESFQLGLAPHILSKLLSIPLYLRYDWICPTFPDNNSCSFSHTN